MNKVKINKIIREIKILKIGHMLNQENYYSLDDHEKAAIEEIKISVIDDVAKVLDELILGKIGQNYMYPKNEVKIKNKLYISNQAKYGVYLGLGIGVMIGLFVGGLK